MAKHPRILTQRFPQTMQDVQRRIRKLESRTASIDSGFALGSMPAVVDSAYVYSPGTNPKVYTNGAATLTGPYPCLDSYTPVAGDAVLLVPYRGNWVIAGLIGPRPWVDMALQGGWKQAADGPVCKYRMGAGRTVEVSGRCTHSGTSGTSQIASVSAPYLPAVGQNWPVTVMAATDVYAATPAEPTINLPVSGALAFTNLPAGTTDVEFHAQFQLDP